jgi:hypothetical protein
MLYTEPTQPQCIAAKSVNQVPNFLFKGFLVVSLFLVSTPKLKAEEHLTNALVIPAYDNSIYNDGFDRWNQKNHRPKGYVIHSSTLFGNIDKQNYDAQRLRANVEGRNDRISFHPPIRYNITLKGYSVYELNEEVIKLWSFDKIDLNMNKKPELFFGVQKPFY